MSRIIGVTVGTSISPEALKRKLNISESVGNSIYYMDKEVEFPVGNGFYTYTIAKTSLSNGGSGIKVGDIIVASNGTLCKVTSVGTMVGYDPIGTISGSGMNDEEKEEIANSIMNALPTWTGGSY
jgi:hypothetical protein